MVECAAVEASHNTSAPFFSSLVSSRPSCGYSFSSFTDPTVLAAHLTVSLYSPPHPKAPFDALSTTALLLLPSPLPEHCLTTLSFASSAVFLLSLASQSLAEHRFTVEARVVKLLSTSLRQRVFFDGFRGTLEASEDGFKAAFKTRSNSCSASFEMKCLPVRDAFVACVRRDNEDYPFVIAAEEEKVVDFTPLPRTGCLAFDITCLSVNLSPFTLRLQSDRHACSYDSIQGIQLDGEKPLLYGDACTEHDVLTFFIDSPQDRFHAFLEGRRIGYSYLEDFGTPAWRAHSMPLHDALTRLQLAVRPFNRVAFDPNILFLPEMPDEEWLARAGVFATSAFAPEAAYAFYTAWLHGSLVLCLSRLSNHFVFVDTDPTRLRQRFPAFSVGQAVRHPSTGAECRVVGQSGGALWFAECADNPFESAREEFSMVWKMSEHWLQKEAAKHPVTETMNSEPKTDLISALPLDVFASLVGKKPLEAAAACIDAKCGELGLWAWNLPPAVLLRACPEAWDAGEWLASCALVLFSNLHALQCLPLLALSSAPAPLLSSTVQLLARARVLRNQRAIEPSVDLQHLPAAIKSFTFNRLSARRERLLSLPSPHDRFNASVTHRLLAVVSGMTPAELKTSFIQHSHGGQRRAFHVVFAGEGGVDNGGLYREVFQTCMLEMHDTAVLDILQPTPNHECAGEVPGKEDFVFDERCQLGAAVFEGLGRVVGVAILSGFQLDLFLSPVLWRLIARERVGLRELEMVDKGLCEQCRAVLRCDVGGGGDSDE